MLSLLLRKIIGRKKAVAIAVSFLFATATGQQHESQPQQGKPDEIDVVRITTNLVQIDAIVTDKNGKQVTDLKAGDFQVLQDGRPQKVTNLSYISSLPAATTSASSVTANINNAPLPAVSLRPDQVRRTIAVVVDDLGLSFESTAFVRKTLTKFVNEQMQPGDLVAVIRTSAGAGALQQFTSDKRQLAAAIDRVRWYPLGRADAAIFAPLQPDIMEETANSIIGAGAGTLAERAAANARKLGAAAQTEAEDLDELREQTFTVGTLGALSYVVRGLGQLPGRKSVLLVSDGFRLFSRLAKVRTGQDDRGVGIVDTDAPGLINNSRVLESLRRLTDEANRASVVVNSMDIRGLQTLTLTANDTTNGLQLSRVREGIANRQREFFDTQAGLAYLARLTGGLAIQNTNDFNGGIKQVLDDQSGYYLIGYRPDDSTFDSRTGRSGFHKIAVKIVRPDLKVRSRSGFYGVPDEEAKERRKSSAQLADLIASPFGVADIHLRLTSLFGNDERLGSLLSSVLYIDGRDLTFKEEPDGWREAEVEVLAYTFGANGEVIDSLSRTHKVRARDELYESMIRDGLLYTVNVPIKKAGAYQLRIAVRDIPSRRVGSASQFVEVPDLSKASLALSGIFVSGLDPQTVKQAGESNAVVPAAGSAGEGQASPAVRRLRAGMEMHYAYYIYNAKVDVGGKPQLTTQIRLFHDGKLSYEGKVVPYDVGHEPDLKRLRAGGRINLSAKAEAGDYILQIIVIDTLGKQKKNMATQWIDFQIYR